MPHGHMACPGGGSSLVSPAPRHAASALQELLCSPGGKRIFHIPGTLGGDMSTCRAGPGSGAFSPASPALQIPPLPQHFRFCCGRITLLRNPTLSFCTTKRLSKTSWRWW